MFSAICYISEPPARPAAEGTFLGKYASREICELVTWTGLIR